MRQPPFQMERWQSLHEHRVEHNLSESGVDPLSVGELCRLAGRDPEELLAETRLGYIQTNGSDGLRERIAALYAGAGPENVLVTTGSAEANFLALWSLLEPGDRFVFVGPTYAQTPGLARGLGAEVSEVRLRPERGWGPEPGSLGAALDRRTKLLVVTNPNNPTGTRLPEEAREELLDEAGDAWILSDEVYAGAERLRGETASLWGAGGRVLVSGSLSKAYGLPGLRIGWLVGPAERIAELWARKDYTTIAPAALSDRLARLALDPEVRPRILARTRAIVARNWEILSEWLAEAPGLEEAPVPPEAGAIAFVGYEGDLGSEELCEELRREERVLVVPGAHFGMEGYLRFGFGLDAAELRAALERTAAGLGRVMAARGAA